MFGAPISLLFTTLVCQIKFTSRSLQRGWLCKIQKCESLEDSRSGQREESVKLIEEIVEQNVAMAEDKLDITSQVIED